jgi:hypothetical protein
MTSTPDTHMSMKTARRTGAGFGVQTPFAGELTVVSGAFAVRTAPIGAARNLPALAERGAG